MTKDKEHTRTIICVIHCDQYANNHIPSSVEFMYLKLLDRERSPEELLMGLSSSSMIRWNLWNR